MTRRLLTGALLLLVLGASVAMADDDIFDDEIVDVEEDAEPVAQPVQQRKPRRSTAAQARPADFDPEFDKGPEASFEAVRTPPKRQPTPSELAEAAQARAAAAAATSPSFGVLECLGLGFFLLYGLNYLWGKRTNEAIAQRWGLVFSELLETQFAQVGEEGAIVTQESPDTFTIDATGRERCDWLQARLQLASRQDLYEVAQRVIAPKPDKLVLDFGVAEEDAEVFVLAVLDKRLDRAYVQELADLKTLTSQCPAGDVVPASLRALCEAREIAAELLGGEVGGVLQTIGASVESVHYTDFVPTAWGLPAGTKRALHLVFRLPPGGAHAATEATRPMLRLALLLLDRIGRVRMSPQLKEKLKKGRATADALKFKEGHKQREEQAQQRKAEKLQQRKNKEPLADREQQRKREEKEARQAAKKRPGIKMRKM